jgi:hypothetical protein
LIAGHPLPRLCICRGGRRRQQRLPAPARPQDHDTCGVCVLAPVCLGGSRRDLHSGDMCGTFITL